MQATQLFKIDENVCVKCGGCISMYPNLFEFDEKGNVRVKVAGEVSEDQVSEIKGICPVGAIVDK